MFGQTPCSLSFSTVQPPKCAMNRKNFVRTLLWTCWLPLLCAFLGAGLLADNAAYAHHQSLGWDTPAITTATGTEPAMPANEPTIPDATLPARYHLEGAIFGFLSGAVIVLLAATVAGSLGPVPVLKKARRVMA
jgi:hypothetical protein